MQGRGFFGRFIGPRRPDPRRFGLSGECRPKGAVGSGSCQINRIGFRDEGVGPPRRRLDIIEVTTRGRGQELAADVVRDGDHGRFIVRSGMIVNPCPRAGR